MSRLFINRYTINIVLRLSILCIVSKTWVFAPEVLGNLTRLELNGIIQMMLNKG